MRNRHPATGRKYQIIHIFPRGVPAAPGREGFRDPDGDGEPTEAGFYFALWPAPHRRDDVIRYFGPFDTYTVPNLLKLAAEFFSLVEPAKVDPGIGAGNPEGTVICLADRGARRQAAARPTGPAHGP